MDSSIKYFRIICFLILVLGCNNPENHKGIAWQNDQGKHWRPATSDHNTPGALPDSNRVSEDQQPINDRGSGYTASGEKKKADRKKKKQSLPFNGGKIDQRIESIRNMKASEKELDLPSYQRILKQKQGGQTLDEYLFLKNLNTYFAVNFDNDIFANRDWYYTNGIQLDLVSPSLGWSGLSKLLLPYKKKSSTYHGLSLVHRMFTPKDPHLGSVPSGDRPFSSYVYLGYFTVTNSLTTRYRQLSAIHLGVIGSAAMAKPIMELIHFTEEPGWNYQVTNDLVLDYQVHLEKGLIYGKFIEMGGMLDAHAGTLYDKIGMGPYVIAGFYNPDFIECIAEDTWTQTNPKNTKVQGFLYYRFKSTLVGYDATLQGGLFTQSDYTLIPGAINRFTFENHLGLSASYRWMALHAEYVWLSPEFEGCVPHRWMRWNLTFTF